MKKMMKPEFYSAQAAVHKSQRAEHAATKSFANAQATATHQGRPQASFAAPPKKVPRSATGGYLTNPFKNLIG
jgi:hypothetical protein